MSLKRPQHSMDELASPERSSSSRTKGSKSRRSRRTLHSAESTCSSSSSSSSSCSSDAGLPLASAPRTVEIMWGGRSAPGFTLKRKRTGAILVSTVTRETQVATTLKVGSELKLVGGFPVNRLTLQDVKKVMLMAPKPVSLVFVNADDVVIASVDDVEADRKDRRSLASTTLSTASLRRSVSVDMNSLKRDDSGEDSDSSEVSTVSAPAFYSTPSESNKSKKRKVSTLQVALDRVNQLLNRPVRQAGLHIAAGKSIVV
ncbi:hypothetical protein PHYSODRAFT_560932 [Phytophthora sojae]|uniref:PDZ domain-containing protein n=1 Tax=Phytophthora sojae (strain P6497) TaxID=1094619 RepID=G4ZNN1_PHYSP|nr:hypothetical protein PHYSODRAFT_346482 [Phytophthora sojae]XP_009528509.1 hypothetical protein PHYSODRAFT_560932 [Phytophthora sojae]EGZ14712.1 hypothetical protein PHYSODRAFT_346482 [Phytophthora sojae]EGZ14760.1 hypothetical protein PHYSODRAFT_560932 [Phytophthora sojae]|eukprot:XP_009528461.1 hypothetical protein PHYSODRAFT_346482 [Phytophthora sojae]